MSSEAPKYCVDCKYSQKGPRAIEMRCVAPRDGQISLVTGNEIVYGLSCDDMRGINFCGPEAKLFVSRWPKWEPIKPEPHSGIGKGSEIGTGWVDWILRIVCTGIVVAILTMPFVIKYL
jgi:hypothetical protein